MLILYIKRHEKQDLFVMRVLCSAFPEEIQREELLHEKPTQDWPRSPYRGHLRIFSLG